MVDCGSGIVMLAVMLGALFATTRFPSSKAGTPRWRLFLVLFYLGALVVQAPLVMFVLGMRQRRFDYPVWGDSIGIGIFQTCTTTVVLGGIGLVLLLVTLAFVKFPVTLWVWSSGHKVFSTLISVAYGILIAFVLLLLVGDVPMGKLGSIVVDVVLIYTFLSLRAGIIEKKRQQRLEAVATLETEL